MHIRCLGHKNSKEGHGCRAQLGMKLKESALDSIKWDRSGRHEENERSWWCCEHFYACLRSYTLEERGSERRMYQTPYQSKQDSWTAPVLVDGRGSEAESIKILALTEQQNPLLNPLSKLSKKSMK